MTKPPFIGEHIDIPLFDPAAQTELTEVAIGHEGAALAHIEAGDGAWRSLKHQELTTHFAIVGAETEARIALGRIGTSDMSRNDVFAAQFSIAEAFGRPHDIEATRRLASDPVNTFYDTDQKLKVVLFDLEHGRREHLPEYIATIGRETERTMAGIALAQTTDEILALRDGYTFKSHLIGVNEDRTDHESNNGAARINLAVANRDVEGVHDDVIDTLRVLVRPDEIKADVHEYIGRLLAAGEREKVEEVIEAVTRKGYVDHYNAENAQVHIASVTHEAEDVERAVETAMTTGNEFIQAGLINSLVGVYVDMGDVEAAQELVAAVKVKSGYGTTTIPYDKSRANLELLRGYLKAGDVDSANQAYNAAVISRHASVFISGRLMVARYLRVGDSITADLLR